jgi:hypothetical protein
MVTENTSNYTWMRTTNLDVPQINITPPNYRTSSLSSNLTCHIGLHTEHTHNKQIFTWIASYDSYNVVALGQPQMLQTSSCSKIRGNLVGLLQAINKILRHRPMAPLAQPPQLKIYSRDIKVLNKIHRITRTNRSPSNMISEERGLLEEILPLLRNFPHRTVHQFKKQDKPGSIERFLITQCIRPILAGPTALPSTYVPSGPATLWLDGIEVSTAIASTLRNTSTMKTLHEYWQRKYNWNNITLRDIEWSIYSKAIHPFPLNQRKTITQFNNGWLPVNGHPGRALTIPEQECPACRLQKETIAHLFKCPILQEQWKMLLSKSHLTTPASTEENHINTILLWSITEPFELQKTHPLPDVPIEYKNLIQAQTLIGWDHILMGRWTSLWITHLDMVSSNQGTVLAANKLTHIWKMLLELWHFRCNMQHQTDDTTHDTWRQQITPKVQDIYAQENRLDQVDKQILVQPIHRTLQLPKKNLKEWIQRTEAFVKKGIQRARQRLMRKNHSITTFFHPSILPTRTNDPQPDHLALTPNKQYQPNYTARENFKPP